MAPSDRPEKGLPETDTDRLRFSEARYRTLFEHAPEAQVVLDADAGRFVEANAQAEVLFGLDRSALLEMNPESVSPPTQPDGRPSADAVREVVERALAGETPHFEWTHRHASGRDILCELRLVRMPAADQRLVRGSITDITERRRLEEELHQSRKMEAIGQLAGGIAHDFNNLLTVINSYAELALKETGPDGELASYLREIRKSGQRAASLTSQLLAFGRKQVVAPRVLDLNRVVGELLGMLRRVIGENIELVTVFDGDARPVRIDPGQLEQIVINLAVNARDAMPAGGTLTISTHDADAAGEAPGESASKPFTVLTIGDTGEGIPPGIREHIFEPFFTTKGRGTGLGLSTVYGIVEQNGGHVRVADAAHRGAVFEIWLPSTDEQLSDGAEPAQGVARGRETILVVEDEESVRQIVVATLGRYGYRVLEASDGAAALALAGGTRRAIDLLVTDVVMPGMTGLELCERLAVPHPETAVLLISGYADDLIPEGALRAGVAFLPKPFTPELLGERVRQLLDERD